MRRPFWLLTIFALLLAVALGVARQDVRYYTRMAVADLAALRFPGRHLASSYDRLNLDARLAPGPADAMQDPSTALAGVELAAAGAFCPDPDPAEVSVRFQELIKVWPNSPLVHYRYGSYLLARMAQIARRSPGGSFAALPKESADYVDAEELAREARWELLRASSIDPQNSIFYYELAWSYLVFGDTARAVEWFGKGLDAPEYDPGDDSVVSAVARLATDADTPALESLLAVHRVANFQPSYHAARIESLAAVLLSDKAVESLALDDSTYGAYLACFEDMSEKLLQTAFVVRQSQASLAVSGRLWRRVMAEADDRDEKDVYGVAWRRLAETSYQYLLLGWQRAGAGLIPQQQVLELDIPVELRLPFSPVVQWVTRIFALVVFVCLVPAVILGLAAIRLKELRQVVLALSVLIVFAALAYSASFYATARERSATTQSLAMRVRVACESPRYLREHGKPSVPGDFRTDIPKAMLYTLDYTLEAGRVLAYVGTRECYDLLIESLSRQDIPRPVELVKALNEATGLDFGYDVEGSKTSQMDAIHKWQQWWRDHRNAYPEASAPTAAPVPPTGSPGTSAG